MIDCFSTRASVASVRRYLFGGCRLSHLSAATCDERSLGVLSPILIRILKTSKKLGILRRISNLRKCQMWYTSPNQLWGVINAAVRNQPIAP